LPKIPSESFHFTKRLAVHPGHTKLIHVVQFGKACQITYNQSINLPQIQFMSNYEYDLTNLMLNTDRDAAIIVGLKADGQIQTLKYTCLSDDGQRNTCGSDCLVCPAFIDSMNANLGRGYSIIEFWSENLVPPPPLPTAFTNVVVEG
jgi:hypothetical protein